MSFNKRKNNKPNYRKRRSFHQGNNSNRGRNRDRGRGTDVNIASFIQKAIRAASEATKPEEINTTFHNYNLHPQIVDNLTKQGFSKPTPIQHQTIPHILDNKDVVGLANTGTGKTAAFLIPLLHNLAHNHQTKTLIIAPTRELALQINTELKKFRGNVKAWSVLCIGGTSMNRQLQDLKSPHQFIIGTPGRLKDLSNQGVLNLNSCDKVVLDEIDSMMDMGFLPDIKYLLSKLPQDRQSLFFSATMPPKIHALSQQFLTQAITISVKTTEVSTNVEQRAIPVPGNQKTSKLVELLHQKEFQKVLVFGRTKRGVKKLAFTLQDHGFRTDSLHGNKSLGKRKKALQAFKDNHIDILVATDVASRGIDVADVTHVVNYDAPESYEDYVHRIGRTGRAGNKGIALTFVS